MQNTLYLVVDRFEGHMAVLRGEGGLEVVYPKKNLPKEAREGSVVVLTAQTGEENRKMREKTAKELLREILAG